MTTTLTDKLTDAATTVRVLARAGLIRPEHPLAMARAARAGRHWGKGLAGAVAANAARMPDRTCLIDELGTVTHAELNQRSSRLAGALHELGVGSGDVIAVLCRDHRYFVEATVATAKLGADLLLLNTSFSKPQLHDVLEREGARVVVYDAEFEGLVDGAADSVLKVLGWADGAPADAVSIDSLVRRAAPEPAPPASGPGRTILLTSGTTGTPKGARRPPEVPTSAVIAVLERIPVHARERHFVVAPMFHAWGFAHFGIGMLLGCEIILRRRFGAEETLAAIDRYKVQSAAMVPVMAQRILELPEETRARYDCSSLRVIALGGSAIPGDLAVRVMNAFGDVVYNSYGSTEVAMVSIAGPEDLRADHTTAGRPVRSIVVKLLGDDGSDCGRGPGRIFVGSEAAFEGYTGGDGKLTVDGLMSTGDMGSFDDAGRLRIEGRDDDMIVSGGENVYPREVEDVILALDGVREAAVLGADDADFGQRLVAFVVKDESSPLDADAVRAAVRERLARFKIPRDVTFLDALPRTATGKVLKRELR